MTISSLSYTLSQNVLKHGTGNDTIIPLGIIEVNFQDNCDVYKTFAVFWTQHSDQDVPSAPLNVQAAAFSTAQIYVSWDHPATRGKPDILNYEVEVAQIDMQDPHNSLKWKQAAKVESDSTVCDIPESTVNKVVVF